MSAEAYYSIQVPKQKPLGPSFRGGFYSFFLWWLIPQAGHRLFVTIQPFVDAITRYTSHDSEYKADYSIHILTSFPYRWEAVTVLPQHIMYCNYVEACQ